MHALTLLVFAPCEGRARDRAGRCVGPVVDESGGGGDTLTIVLSVLVGLVIAGVAFVLLRRQLTTGEHG
jgi:hypothetical protein